MKIFTTVGWVVSVIGTAAAGAIYLVSGLSTLMGSNTPETPQTASETPDAPAPEAV